MTLPNFIIIGAGRCGTTSIYHYLKQHPQIFMSPIKETRYFAYPGPVQTDDQALVAHLEEVYPIRSLQAYRDLFCDVQNEIAVGEASPIYISSPLASNRIYRQIPDVRLIAILRNPVDRAFASHLSQHRDGLEIRSFEQAVTDELSGMPRRHGAFWSPYLATGFYYRNLMRYFNRFQREQIALYFFEDFQANGLTFLQTIFRFLGVDSEFEPDMSVRHNTTGLPRRQLLHELTGKNSVLARLKTLLPDWILRPAYSFAMKRREKNLIKPEVPPDLRHRLSKHYRNDILTLQALTGRDLSSWLSASGQRPGVEPNG